MKYTTSPDLSKRPYFWDKVRLRLNNLPDKDSLCVLDAFSGSNRNWNKVKQLSSKKFNVIGIDKKNNKNAIYLKGDNIKFLKSMNLSLFDIIDLDAYGIPFKQLDIVLDYFDKKTKHDGCYVFLTFIQALAGVIPKKLLYSLGYTKPMIDKIPTLFYKNGFGKLKNYLFLKGIKSITHRSIGTKHYIFIQIPKKI